MPEKASYIIDKIRARCGLISTSIKEMLELAKLKSCAEEDLKMELVNLDKIIGLVIDSFASILETRNIEIKMESKVGEGTVVRVFLEKK